MKTITDILIGEPTVDDPITEKKRFPSNDEVGKDLSNRLQEEKNLRDRKEQEELARIREVQRFD